MRMEGSERKEKKKNPPKQKNNQPKPTQGTLGEESG